MEDRFNKEKSLERKGVAIIFMFWLHLYGHDNLIQNGNYYTELWGGNAVPAYVEQYMRTDFYLYSRIWVCHQARLGKVFAEDNRWTV